MTNRTKKTDAAAPAPTLTDAGDDANEEVEENEIVDVALGSQATPTATGKGKNAKKIKYPCGKCELEATGTAIFCGSCDQWYHSTCVEGMTPAYFDNCKMTFETLGRSAFLCKTCRKVWGKVNKEVKSLKNEVKEVKDQVMVLELAKEALAQRVEKLEMMTQKVDEKVVGVEKEISRGMEKAKDEVIMDVRTEMTQMNERGSNIVIIGMEETKEEDKKKWRESEQKKVEELFEKLEVEVKGEVQFQFRAGKPRAEGEKSRPIIVRVSDDETRNAIFRNAPKLAKIEGMGRVYINPDLTPQQRDEEKKKEAELKEEAARKTEAENGSGKKYIVIGSRGRRRVVVERARE